MNGEKFDEILERRIVQMRDTLASKRKEYAASGDRLHNFKRASEMLRVTPEAALIGMWAKHIVSILDIVDGLPAYPSIERVEEKIGDAINYLILLEAALKERIYDEQVFVRKKR